MKPSLSVSEGPLITTLTIAASAWTTAVVRLTKGMPYVEVEWTVGPIPQSSALWPDVDGKVKPMGKEVIVKYSSGLKTTNDHGAAVFYTDSNAREMVKRVFNARGPSYPTLNVTEPVAGNYYPVRAAPCSTVLFCFAFFCSPFSTSSLFLTPVHRACTPSLPLVDVQPLSVLTCSQVSALIAVTDDAAKAELAVLVDRAMGGSSLSSGDIELMLHRRVLEDDRRGVSEPLNETMCGCTACDCAGLTLKGRHYVVLDTVDSAHEARRLLSEEMSFPSLVGFDKPSAALSGPFSLISSALPKNVKLMTLKNMPAEDVAYAKGHVLVRLAHLFQVGEHSSLAAPVNVSLAALFSKAALKVR